METDRKVVDFRQLVERLPQAVLVVELDRIRYYNPAAEQLLGVGLVDAVVYDVANADDHERIKETLVRAASENITSSVRIGLACRSGMEIDLVCWPAQDEGSPAMFITLEDLTTQRRLVNERVRLDLAEEVNRVLREEINEHRRTQEELKRSRQFARNLIDSSLDMIMAADSNGNITEYNPAASLRFGYEADEVMGRNTAMLYADPDEYRRIQGELVRNSVYAGEVRNVDKFGNAFTTYLAASRLFDESGNSIGAMGVSRDITRLKHDQEALMASEERYRDLFETASDLIQSVAIDGRFDYVNDAWRRTLGYTDEEVARSTIWDIVHDDSRAIFEGALSDRTTAPNGPIRVLFVAKDGRTITTEGTIDVRFDNGRTTAVRSILHDITSVLVARQRLSEHEAKMRALFESSEHMFWTVDSSIRITSYNIGYANMIERLHGVRPEINTDPVGPRKRFASEEHHAFWDEKYAQAFAGTPIRFETDLIDKKGERVCNEVFLSPVFGPDGEVREVFGVGHEITDQKVAEDTVREQAARLQAIFESSANMMIWTLDKSMRITSCNAHFLRSIEQVHGLDLRVGDNFTERMAARVTPETAKALLVKYSAALRGKPQQFEVELFDVRGRSTWVENFLNPIIVEGEVQELSCLAYGITDRKLAQVALVQSLGEKEVLLKEVHHRVKNNLQVINSIMKLQSARVEDDARLTEILHHSRDRVRSMALIHESLYQNKQFSLIDLGNYIDGLARNLVMSYSLNERVALDLDLGTEQVYLVLDQASPCGLVLNELISNALKHAFPANTGGVVRVALRLDGDRVSITVSDNGAGLPPGFDDAKHGNLGLELVHMLVGQLDGRIERSGPPGVTYLFTFERIKQTLHGADERPRSGG